VAIAEVQLHAKRRARQGKRTFGKPWKISRLAHTCSLRFPLDSFAKSLHSHCCGLELGYNPLLFDVVNISIEDSKDIPENTSKDKSQIHARESECGEQ
jgi:hypothetical protein